MRWRKADCPPYSRRKGDEGTVIMRCVWASEKKRIKMAVSVISAALICTAATMGSSGSAAVMRCEAKEGNDEKEVTAFVTAYYEAQTPEGIETLADYMAEPESPGFQLFLAGLQTTFERGLTEQKIMEVVVRPLSDGEHWLAAVSSEWVIRGFDVTLPGLKVQLVGRNQDGEFKLEEYGGSASDEAMLEEIREIALSDEIVELTNEVAMKYNEVISENSEMMEWMLETSRAADEAKADVTGRILDEREDADMAESGAKSGLYVVKKGDCLWSIAEEQLGDGMLWSGIYEANKAVIGDNPDLIYVGVELQLK